MLNSDYEHERHSLVEHALPGNGPSGHCCTISRCMRRLFLWRTPVIHTRTDCTARMSPRGRDMKKTHHTGRRWRNAFGPDDHTRDPPSDPAPERSSPHATWLYPQRRHHPARDGGPSVSAAHHLPVHTPRQMPCARSTSVATRTRCGRRKCRWTVATRRAPIPRGLSIRWQTGR